MGIRRGSHYPGTQNKETQTFTHVTLDHSAKTKEKAASQAAFFVEIEKALEARVRREVKSICKGRLGRRR
jgi:hypothetical protein